MKRFIINYFFVILLVITTPAYCSIIDGPADFRVSTNGKIIFSLNDNVYVKISRYENDCVLINLKCWVSLDKFENLLLNKGVLLEDIDGEILGNILNDTSVLKMHFMSGDKACISIRGYTDKSNIRNINSYPTLIQPVDILKLNNCIKYYLENEFRNWSERGKKFSAHRLMGIDIENDFINVYLWAYIMEYYPAGDNIRKGSGSSIPLKLRLIQYKDSYKIVGFETASSGEGYGERIRKIFPKKCQDKIFNHTKYFKPHELDLETKKQAENYYNRTYKSRY